MLTALALIATIALPRTAHLGVSTIHSPPRSLVAARNGSSIPAGGAVWPSTKTSAASASDARVQAGLVGAAVELDARGCVELVVRPCPASSSH